MNEQLIEYAFSDANPGWRPEIQESPNGDGVWDTNKRFAHIAPKYFNAATPQFVRAAYEKQLGLARHACRLLRVPEAFYPGPDCTLRVLDYPAGATTAPHTDFDLFTMRVWRDDANAFKYLGDVGPNLVSITQRYPGLHFGELLAEVSPKRFVATKHEVIASDEPQSSCVFFVMPDLDAVLPSGITVGEWVEERKARSRRDESKQPDPTGTT